MKARFLGSIFVCACALFYTFSVQAAQSSWVAAEYMKARVIASQEEGQPLELAVQVQMNAGWHSYWRSPGDAGLPYRFIWDGSQNLEGFDVSWPVPKAFDEAAGLKTYGYTGNIVFPVSVRRVHKDMSAQVVLMLHAMACKDICVPQSMLLKLELPKDDIGTVNKNLIEFGKRSVPHIGDLPDLKIDTRIGKDGKILLLVRDPFAKEGVVYLELPESGQVLEGIPWGHEGGSMYFAFDSDEDLAGREVIVTVVSGKNAVEKRLQF